MLQIELIGTKVARIKSTMSQSHLTDEQRQQVATSYQSGSSQNDIACLFGIRQSDVSYLLRKNSVAIRPIRKLTSAQEQEACERYQEGESSTQIGRAFGVHGVTILRLLHSRKIERRSQEECNRKFTCNHAYFSKITTQDQAYWLGVLAADGYIDPPNMLWIELGLQDRVQLEDFRRCLSSTHPIHEDHRRVRFFLRSQQLVDDLARYGIVNRKAHTVPWPSLPKRLMRHYLRGFFDGDGCFTLQECGPKERHWRKSLVFQLTGNRLFLEGAEEYIRSMLDLPRRKLIFQTYSKSTFNLRYGSTPHVLCLCELMYPDAKEFLVRKREVVGRYLQQYPNVAKEYHFNLKMV